MCLIICTMGENIIQSVLISDYWLHFYRKNLANILKEFKKKEELQLKGYTVLFRYRSSVWGTSTTYNKSVLHFVFRLFFATASATNTNERNLHMTVANHKGPLEYGDIGK